MKDNHRAIFSGLQILSDQAWLQNKALVVENEKIKAIIPAEMIPHHLPAKQYIFPSNYCLIPGLIDLHIHGTHGKDVMDADQDALMTIARGKAEEGVTGFLATTMTTTNDKMVSVLRAISEARKNREGAAILGAHLEGPFIAQDKLGAQSAHTQLPNIELFKEWQDISQNVIKLVTLAPELPNALEFIEALDQMGIVTSIGHTNATYEQTKAAILAGCTHATHLFNAMRGIHQREPGALAALLLSQEVMTELIVDGVHLHPTIVDLTLRLKHKGRVLLVTDAMRGKCLSPGNYELGGQTVYVAENKASLADGTLAGSVLSMTKAIQNMVTFTGCSLIDAIEMASLNPARVLNLDETKATLDVGKDADMAVMNPNFEAVLTVCAGREIFKA